MVVLQIMVRGAAAMNRHVLNLHPSRLPRTAWLLCLPNSFNFNCHVSGLLRFAPVGGSSSSWFSYLVEGSMDGIHHRAFRPLSTSIGWIQVAWTPCVHDKLPNLVPISLSMLFAQDFQHSSILVTKLLYSAFTLG